MRRSNSRNEKPGICVVTYPRPKASVVPLSNLMKIVSRLSDYPFLITGNEGEQVFKEVENIRGYSLKYKVKSFIIFRLLANIILQLKIALSIVRVSKEIDVFVFYMSEGLILPMITCKFTRKPTILALAGSLSRISETNKDLLSRPFILMEDASYYFADKLLIYSNKLISDWGLEKYRSKTLIAHEHFLDIDIFNIKTQLKDRGCIVGYVGRLSEEKGVFNLIKAIPQIINIRDDINYVIGGEGKLKSDIGIYLAENNFNEKVKLLGWISHDELAKYLNNIKLLVLPSYTEGLPNIMLEAMACGTLVLATPVGAITDFIKDEETGFIMKDNSSECIAENIIRALNYPNLERIIQNARSLMLSQFTYEKTIENYRTVLDNLRI